MSSKATGRLTVPTTRLKCTPTVGRVAPGVGLEAPTRGDHVDAGGLVGVVMRELDLAVVVAALVRAVRGPLNDVVPFQDVVGLGARHNVRHRVLLQQRVLLLEAAHAVTCGHWRKEHVPAERTEKHQNQPEGVRTEGACSRRAARGHSASNAMPFVRLRFSGRPVSLPVANGRWSVLQSVSLAGSTFVELEHTLSGVDHPLLAISRQRNVPKGTKLCLWSATTSIFCST